MNKNVKKNLIAGTIVAIGVLGVFLIQNKIIQKISLYISEERESDVEAVIYLAGAFGVGYFASYITNKMK